ncbi:VPLPA-CTERM sorting domain-containing protein [Arenibacterium halophilum]|uniref:VPLPA-CTERM sorting domain-containing protein n=1 Tax=Arenibacterium halophilum TaxID=2583821 RepID=A0ABY2XDR0_9RHOB|nr:VPLPA-CTERM sorting domain-containing protein [Arenibacterium halophilum]TMV14505.1 VPLPA-CTERM sorting domain-containing protein [Arenibacterium halophilum]
MSRSLFLTTTALVALGLPGVAAAATCSSALVGGNPVLTCDQPATDPVSDASDTLTVNVTSGADVTSTDKDVAALELNGIDVTVNNAGTIQNTDTDKDANAITGIGSTLTVTNSGTIHSGDRAIHMLDGFSGGLTVVNEATGVITSRRQTIRTEEAAPNSTIENHGLISSVEGRAIQVRGQGSSVVNYGTIEGGEEVIEARDDFTLTNYGTIRLRDGVDDEDGTQLASGTVKNYGLILGSDDGVDIDEGEIYNYAGASIISTGPEGAGIDVDDVFDNSRDPVRAANPLYVENAGYIEGRFALGADENATSEINVVNSGTLYGRSGVAISLAPGQGDSSVTLTGASVVMGDVVFGGGDDLLTVASLTSGVLGDGLFDGGDGFDTLVLGSYALTDLLSFDFDGTLVDLALQTANGVVTAQFTNFENWMFGNGDSYSTSALAAAVPASQVPLPAGMALLLGGLGGFATLRRRKA